MSVPKRTIGSVKHAQVNLTPDIKSPEITFITEGVETGLSIREAALTHVKNAQVLATLGKQNIRHIKADRIAEKVILVVDNDLQKIQEDRPINDAIRHFENQGKLIEVMCPEALNNQKTDYNDLAKSNKHSTIEYDVLQACEKINGEDRQVGEWKNQVNMEVEIDL